MLALVLLLALQTAASPSAADPFAPLAIYNGAWSVKAQHPFGNTPGPDILQNRCTHGVAFYTCEQVVNGKSAALVIFTLSKEPGKFDVDNILPNGHASSDTDLFVKGDHWTYLSNSSAGHPHYRTENYFKGPDSIHFDQFETTDDGKTWTKTNEGDEIRLHP